MCGDGPSLLLVGTDDAENLSRAFRSAWCQAPLPDIRSCRGWCAVLASAGDCLARVGYRALHESWKPAALRAMIVGSLAADASSVWISLA
jgi:hypothetical protein